MPSYISSVTRPRAASQPISRRAFTTIGGAALAAPLLPAAAYADDNVVFRMNWQYYESHGIFFLGVRKGYYQAQKIAGEVRFNIMSGCDPTAYTRYSLAEPLRVCRRAVEVGRCFEQFVAAIGCRIAGAVE